MKQMKVKEAGLLAAIQQAINVADEDELARIAGELLGGECYMGYDSYIFAPDENYTDILTEFAEKDDGTEEGA